MIDNVMVVIGDNAVGKTRYLEKISIEFLNRNSCVVSNLDKRMYQVNQDKKNIVLELGSEYLRNLMLDGGTNYYDLQTYNLLRYTISDGDILILDEVDVMLKEQDLIDFCSVLSQLRDYWKQIIVSGYSPDLTRLFTYIDYEDYDDGFEIAFGSKITKANLLVLKNEEVLKITNGDDVYEYFYSIRR